MASSTIEEATEKFLAAAKWLNDEDAPAVALLRLTAKELDQDYTAAKANVFGLTHRQLLKKSRGDAGLDEDEQFLEGL